MSAFDSSELGTPESAWAASDRLAALRTVDAPGRDRRIVLLAAHPDDETLGAGGLLATAAAAGLHIDVLVASDGAASHPDSPTHTPADLAAIRADELRAAVAILAPGASLRQLDLPDGGLGEHGAALRAALRRLVEPDADAAADTVDTDDAGTVPIRPLLLSTWRGDGHPDHAACGRAAADVAAELGLALWEFPIWAWHWADPDADPDADPAAAELDASPDADPAADPKVAALPWSSMRRLPLGAAARAAKAAAGAAYPSQIAPLSDRPGDEAVVAAHVQAHFERDFETFVITAPAGEQAYFDQLYATGDDPWGLDDRFYERRKRDVVIASLPRPRFRRAFEPGCATGLHTVELARRCDEVVAWDITERAVELTRQRIAAAGVGDGVQVALGAVPADWPDGQFDLVLISEIGYFIADLDGLAARVEAGLAPDGVVVACHWRHPGVENPSTTEAVHAALGAGRHLLLEHREEDFLLQAWTRSAESVARTEGIVR